MPSVPSIVINETITFDNIPGMESLTVAVKADNVGCRVATVHDLIGMDGRFDLIMSNGVFNLIPEKDKALAVTMKLLKPGGKLFIADQFLIGPMTKDIKERVASWFQ